MNIIVILAPLSLMLAALALVFFFWTVANRQYEDPTGDAERILMDDPEDRPG